MIQQQRSARHLVPRTGTTWTTMEHIVNMTLEALCILSYKNYWKLVVTTKTDRSNKHIFQQTQVCYRQHEIYADDTLYDTPYGQPLPRQLPPIHPRSSFTLSFSYPMNIRTPHQAVARTKNLMKLDNQLVLIYPNTPVTLPPRHRVMPMFAEYSHTYTSDS